MVFVSRRKSKLILGLGSISAIFLVSISFGSACPNLSGTFRCPAWGTQPPQTVVVTTTFNRDGSANYLFVYITPNGTKTTDGGLASPKGIKDAKGAVRICTNTQMIHKGPTETGGGTVNFINADGNFQADYDGVTQIICVKQ